MSVPQKVQLEVKAKTSNPVLDEEIESMQISQLWSDCPRSAGDEGFTSVRYKYKTSNKKVCKQTADLPVIGD